MKATSDLPGMLGIACSKCGVTVSPLSWAAAGIARAMARAALAAPRMDLIFMAVVLLSHVYLTSSGSGKSTKNRQKSCTKGAHDQAAAAGPRPIGEDAAGRPDPQRHQ